MILTTAILAIILSIQLLGVVATKSPTMDEKTKIMLGYFPLATGDWRFQVENPPLTTMFQALPLMLLSDRPDPTEFSKWDDPEWQNRWPSAFFSEVADAFPYTYDDLVSKGRVMNIILTLSITALIVWNVYCWMGEAPGLLTLAWLTFSPNWLAQGSLANNDSLAAGLYLLTLLLYWNALQRQGWGRFFVAGLALGASLGTKTSLLLVLPVMIIFSLLYLLGIKDGSSELDFSITTSKDKFIHIITAFTATGLIGFLTIWLIYGFEFDPWRTNWIPLPLPTYVNNVFLPTLKHASIGHSSYLMGQRSMEGWWYYFPVIFLVKTPLPTIIGAIAGGLNLLRYKKWLTFTILTIPPILWVVAAMFTRINIGYRHILPVLPFLIILIASLLWDVQITRRRIVFLSVLFVWLIIGTVSLTPNYLSYFNEMAGGSGNGIAWASDSNLDWGQDLELLKKYLVDKEIPFIYLSYYGIPELPEQYQINYQPFPNFARRNDPAYTPYNPPEGIYAISATHLTGETLFNVFNEDPVDWFNHQEPCDIVGTSIYIYCVKSDPNPPQWLWICAGLEKEIVPIKAQKKLGRPDLPIEVVDCSQVGFLELPNSPGWMLIPANSDGTSTLVDQIADFGSLQFIQRTYEGDPVFLLYKVDHQ